MATESERILKLETEYPYVRQDITDIRNQMIPMHRDHEELKTDIIRYLNRLDNAEKAIVWTDKTIGELKKDIEEAVDILQEHTESYKFVQNARKTMNIIFVALAIEFIGLVCALLAFVFVLTQKPQDKAQQPTAIQQIAPNVNDVQVRSKQK